MEEPRGADDPSPNSLLETAGLELRFGALVALGGVDLRVREGLINGLIGPNGAGKTSVFNCIFGIYTPQAGEISFDGVSLHGLPPRARRELGIARTFQNLALFPSLTVRENVAVAADPGGGSFLAAALRPRRRSQAGRDRVEEAMDALGIGSHADSDVSSLPYGTRKRVELARALAARPRLLMLDEPASGLSHAEVTALGELIRELRDRFALTVLLVEHHMGLVMELCNHVTVLDFGRKIAEGTTDEVRADPAVIEAYLGVPA